MTVAAGDPGSRPVETPVWEKDYEMFKVEDIQNYGKEQFETAVATATGVQSGLQAIASAYGDYAKKSYEDTKSFVEELSGVRTPDKALEAQTKFAKTAYETFVSDSQKIAGLYGDLAKEAMKPLEGIVAKLTPVQAP
jgi:phasin family protein